MNIPKHLQGILGETRVCAEIMKQGLNAAITHGNSKATDLLVFGEEGRYIRVEVKTCYNGRRFVTGFYPKYSDPARLHPCVWAFYLPDKELTAEGDRFFIASHEQVARMQLDVNGGNKTLPGAGVDNLPLSVLASAGVENAWDTIFQALAITSPEVSASGKQEE